MGKEQFSTIHNNEETKFDVVNTPRNVTPMKLNNLTNKPMSKWKTKKNLIIISTFAIIGVIGISVGAYLIYKNHVDNESDAIIEDIKKTSSFSFNVNPKLEKSITDLNGNNGFNIYAEPITTKNGVLTFNGHVSYVQDDLIYDFIMKNNKAYYTIKNKDTNKMIVTDCLAPDQIPPLHEV